MTTEIASGLLNHRANYSYNQDFSLASASYAGATLAYGYDSDGLIVKAGSFAISRHPGNGLPLTASDGVLTVSRAFNGHGELEGESTTVAGQLVAEWQGERDKAGRLIGKETTVAGQFLDHGYEYDPAGRLIGVLRNGEVVEEYEYIPNNERSLENNTLRGIVGQTYTYSAEDHISPPVRSAINSMSMVSWSAARRAGP